MASDVIVPEVGELGMDVTFSRWLKQPGDDVAVGDELFELDTEKSVMVVEAYAAGTLADVRVQDGDIVAPRDVIATILEPGEEPGATITPPPAAPPAVTPPPAAAPSPAVSSGAAPSSAVPATGPVTPGSQPTRSGGLSPKARRIARELGVDTDGLAGSGPGGLVTEADVRAAAASSGAPASDEPTPAPVATPPPDAVERTRRAVADLTTAAWQSIPHFYLQLETDIERGLELAKPTPLLCVAAAQALVRNPACNLRWEGDLPVPREDVDLGLLVDTPTGLLIAVVKRAHELDLAAMAAAVGAAAERARAGKLSTDDLAPRSLTVSNLGMYAVDRFAAVIPKPDVLTLGVGRTRTVPRWDGTTFGPRRVVDLTLSVDHRALDGARAARLLDTLEAILADPVAEGIA
jgi:pyruvate dehydrogenase E2 component (dihydrolipoamide acetyltransferase)